MGVLAGRKASRDHQAWGDAGKLRLGGRWQDAIHHGNYRRLPHQACRSGRKAAFSITRTDEEFMKRRTYLKTMLAAGAGVVAATAQTKARNPIVLYVDMAVDPAKDKEMVNNYHTIFRPAAAKYPGYVDLKIVKLRSALQGSAPTGMNYRFQLTYESEEARQKWINSDIHGKVWPTIENTLTDKRNYTVLLCDAI